MKPVPSLPPNRRGVALVIVLSFVVLLTGLTLAFFSRAISERQIADSSASETKVSLLSEGAVSTIIGDLKGEIVAGSNIVPVSPNPTNVTIYTPKAAINAVPQRVGTADEWPNLVKVSTDAAPFYTGGPTRAANAPSSTASQNGRLISPSRWNSHFLLPKNDPTKDTDATPLVSGGNAFTAPKWIFVANNGTNPTAVNQNVVGRYAYAIYDEGGLLDVNAAGMPTSLPNTKNAYKVSMAFADLKQLTVNGLPGGTPLLSNIQINALVGRRAYVSSSIDPVTGTQTTPDGSFPSTAIPAGYTWKTANYNNYFLFNLTDTSGFLAATRLPQLTSNASVYDRRVYTRQELISLMLRGLVTDGSASGRATLQTALQYLTSYSRGLNQPSYAPVPRGSGTNPRPTILISTAGGNNVGDAYPQATAQDLINPNFLTIRAQSAFTRNDGTTAVIGEPLVKKRFALLRLAWLTYKGPSAGRNTTDVDMTALIANGVPLSLLQQGTVPNIEKYFGLTWDIPNSRWKYNIHNRPNNGVGDSNTGAVHQLAEVAGLRFPGREPDFFELLKASVDPASQGKASTNGPLADPDGPLGVLNFQYLRDIGLDASILQMGANIIDQFDTDGYPTQIVFDDGSGKPARTFRGVENLPYIYRIHPGVLKAREANPTSVGVNTATAVLHSDSTNTTKPDSLVDTGVGLVLAVPDLWNPHDQNSTLGNPRPGVSAGSFRVIANSASPDFINSGTPNVITVGGFVHADAKDTNGNYTYGNYKGNSFDPIGNGSGGPVAPTAVTPNAPFFSRDGTAANVMTGGNPTPINFGYSNSMVIDSATTSSSLVFNIPAPDATGASLFREPTMLATPNVAGTGLSMLTSNPDLAGDLPLKDSGGQSVYTSSGSYSGLRSVTANPFSTSGGVASTGSTALYTGIYLGAYPLRWVGTRWSNSNQNTTGWVYTDMNIGVAGNPINGITYSLQCQDESGAWVTYDEKYVNTSFFWLDALGGMIQPGAMDYAFVDPRTSRFGSPTETNIADSAHWRAPAASANWLDAANRVSITERPDYHGGFGSNFRGTYGAPPSTDWSTYTALGWHYKNVRIGTAVNAIFFEGGLFAQNNPYWASDGVRYNGNTSTGAQDPTFYSDADGVVRRAMGAHMPLNSTTGVGQPLATASTITGGRATVLAQAQSRPKMLNRPFRSVAELGYVFSGNPWKNLDFSTPESGYSGLLDVFSVSDTEDANGLMAGRLNLNTRQPLVLQAVLSGAYTVEVNGAPNGAISATDASDIAAKMTTRTSKQPVAGPNANSGAQPLANLSDLVGHWNSQKAIGSDPATPAPTYTPGLDANHNIDGKLSYDGVSTDFDSLVATNTLRTLPIASVRETAVRSLANMGNTRVWNLMVDVVAQTGRFPVNANGVNNFTVDGEQRCWVHLSIDRFTGEVIDRQLEIVKE